MYALANCTVTVRRGSTTNAYGDDVTDPTTAPIIASGVLAAIQENNQRVWDPATQTPRVVRAYTAMMPSNADVRTNDVLLEETGLLRTFLVENASLLSTGPAWQNDLDLDLRRLDTGARGG